MEVYMRKRSITAVLIAVFSVLLISGCSKPKKEEAAAEPKQDAPAVIKVGATPVPHAEILEFAKPILAKEGVDLEIVQFTDYVQPNLALDKGDLDANYFQHIPYLDSFNADRGLNLVAVAKVHIEPIGLYSAKVKSVAEIKDKAVIAIPNDPSNAGRALVLLEKAGLLKLKEGVGIQATVQDIVENPKNLSVKTLDAAQLPRALQDVEVAVINTNYALEGGLNPSKDALFIENSDSPYANILVVKAERADDPALKKLADVLVSEDVKKFIEEKYKGSILPAQTLITN